MQRLQVSQHFLPAERANSPSLRANLTVSIHFKNICEQFIDSIFCLSKFSVKARDTVSAKTRTGGK